MKYTTTFSGVLATLAMAAATIAQAAASATAAASQVDLARAQQVRAQMQAQASQARDAAQKSTVAGAKPGTVKLAELFANPDRAYPPSCLNSPMPFGMWQNGPYFHQQMTLLGDPLTGDAGERAYTENVDVYVFRVACSGGQSATLVEIDRPSNLDGNSTRYPTFPGVYVSQNGVQDYVVRVANDPNTFYSTNYALNPLIQSDVFVLENFYQGPIQFNYNNPVTVTVDNLATSGHQLFDFTFPAYDPTKYPLAAQPLPISGYLTGNWRDINHSGEGIQTEIIEGDNADGSVSHYIAVAWYTYDSLGIPYWLFGSGSFNVGDTSANMQLAYYGGGGFAGNFGSSATPALWGTLSVQFPDCNTMRFSYQPTAGLDSSVPQASGTKIWTRATTINGLTCQ